MQKSVDTDPAIEALARGPLRWFRDWPDRSVPSYGAGVYTIWDDAGRFIYVGMSGRSITAGMTAPDKPHGLVTRLDSHWSGRRSGDQFCIYVADRLVIGDLRPEDIEAIASGRHSFDARVRSYIHQRLGYRFAICADGAEARSIERQVQRGEWPFGKPLLNPLGDRKKAG
jgi:hypothetical protein